MRGSGLYYDSDVIHVQCLRFCYMSVLQDELHRATRLWHVHKVRTSSNPESPPERPDILYFLPKITPRIFLVKAYFTQVPFTVTN